MAALELTIQRTTIHLFHDARRLEEGEDLNDALLDFFVRLGQALIPPGGSLEGGTPTVAYLGSLFFDVLRKGGVKDGREGHANVANWAKRRLGKGALFEDSIGALAVPVNEMLRDEQGEEKGKHWWLALVLNPRGSSTTQQGEATSAVILDSLACAEVSLEPPLRALRGGNVEAYPIDVVGLGRLGFCAIVHFQAEGDGTDSEMLDPRESRLWLGDQEFRDPELELMESEVSEEPGTPWRLQGTLEFPLQACGQMSGEYVLEYGGPGAYLPPLHVTLQRKPNDFQATAAQFLGGYLSKEWEASGRSVEYDVAQVESSMRLPDVPQQENANDCGYFILEQILRALQLSPSQLRQLSTASSAQLAALPWPSQQDVAFRKAKLREGLGALFEAAFRLGTSDVEVLFQNDAELRKHLQDALWEGPSFAEAAERLAKGEDRGPRLRWRRLTPPDKDVSTAEATADATAEATAEATEATEAKDANDAVEASPVQPPAVSEEKVSDAPDTKRYRVSEKGPGNTA